MEGDDESQTPECLAWTLGPYPPPILRGQLLLAELKFSVGAWG